MRVEGILETALYVADVERAAAFYRGVFDFPVLFESERLIALDVAGRNVLLLFLSGSTEAAFAVPGGVIPPHGPGGRTHFAFAIAPADVEAWRDRLAECGVAIESEVAWPGGSRSVYFRDPDGNLGELMTPGFWAFR